ncbi:MAG: OmpA family protein [Paracoccaceae bacterium]
MTSITRWRGDPAAMIWMRGVCLWMCLTVLPVMAGAVAFDLPSTARLTSETVASPDSYTVPTGSFSDDFIPTEQVQGRVIRRSWRVEGGSITSLQVLDALRPQLEQAGYAIPFECQAQDCGGFDFRFGIEVIPAPDMHVDIRDYRFLAARLDADHTITILVSKLRDVVFIQIVQVDPETDPLPTPVPEVKEEQPKIVPVEQPQDLASALLSVGHVILDDLAFGSGGSKLEDREYPSLRALAGFLQDNPDGTLVLVGHTDTVGDLATNIQLSKRRAETVRTRLIDSHNVDPARVQAEGNGYLSPIASNLTKAGREANRRVEAILKP